MRARALRRLLLVCGLALAAAVMLRPGEATAQASSAADAALAKGSAALEAGRFEEAAASLGEAAERYRREGNAAALGRALFRRAQAEQSLGELRDAARSLEEALRIAEARADAAQRVAILGALGSVRSRVGPAEEAQRALEAAVRVARELGDPALLAAAQNNLGNQLGSAGDSQGAEAAYAESAALADRAGSASLAARARANAARAVLEGGDARRARALADTASKQAGDLPPSHEKAYTLIHLARTYSRLGEALAPERPALRLRSHEIQREAQRVAEQIGDARAASFALGYLGELYEQDGRSAEALQLTQQAIFQAQQVEAPESLYLWHWQSGRLLHALAQDERAIASYGEAVRILEGLRHQLALMQGASGTSFEASVGNVYFELVDLLLRRAAASQDPAEGQRLLVRARNTVELLKKAELRDYFRDECVDAQHATVKNPWQLSATAVVVYPVLLPDRTELLLSFGSGSIERYAVPVGRERVADEARRFREHLGRRTTNQYRREARQLFDWLIRPFAPELRDRGIDTLVFVPWGPLGTVPMAALLDGDRFLIEEYAVAIVPGVELTDPRALDRTRIRPFLAGLSKSVEGFPALENVGRELESVRALYGGRILVDEGFRLGPVRETLADQEFSVVHVATHGRFSGSAEQTFLLAWDGHLTMERLAEYVGLFRFRDVPLELLTLSACETAEGDERAALGLSGVALKAGARSALATLWQVNDAAAARLVVEFYAGLGDGKLSRAKALQRAQRKALEGPPYDHPGYWSPFLLIGSWL
jgi:CHAT domain-containing protein